MQLKIYINDKLWKTVEIFGNKYDPNSFWPQIQADRDAGLLNSYGVQDRLALRFEPVKP